MPYVADLEQSKTQRFVDALCRDNAETLIYISIGGENPADLEEALSAFYVDDTREFELIGIKRSRGLVGVIMCMKPKS